MVLRLRIPAPGGWRQAKCLGTVVGKPGDKGYEDPFFDDEEESLEICNGGEVCKIREACLIFALTNNCKDGNYGGTTSIQRKWLRKKWPLTSGKEPRPEWAFGLAPPDDVCLADLGKTREELLEEDDGD